MISGSEVIETTSKTSYNGNYGLNASWTIYNGNKRLKPSKQEKLNNQAAKLDVETSENSIQESIAQDLYPDSLCSGVRQSKRKHAASLYCAA